MAQGFLDLLLDLQQGSIQRSCLGSDFWKVGNMGGAAVCREYAEYRIRLVLYGDAVLHTLKSESLLIHPKILTRKSESVLIHFLRQPAKNYNCITKITIRRFHSTLYWIQNSFARGRKTVCVQN